MSYVPLVEEVPPVLTTLPQHTINEGIIQADSSKEKVSLALCDSEISKDSQIDCSSAATEVSSGAALRAQRITVKIISTWGNTEFCGLTGVKVLQGPPGHTVSIPPICVHVSHPEVSTTSANTKHRTPNNLFKGDYLASDGFLMSFRPGCDHSLTFDLGEKQAVSAVRFWNYNRATEDTGCGVKGVVIFLDSFCHGTFVLRRAPEFSIFDFGQTILLGKKNFSLPQEEEWGLQGGDKLIGNQGSGDHGGSITYVSPPLRQDFETLLWPSGLLLRIVIHSSWGDAYYVGLDGIQLVGVDGQEVNIRGDQVFGVPDSLRVIGQEEDVRVSTNVVDGLHGRGDAQNAWLTPLTASLEPLQQAALCGTLENELYILLDKPVTLSLVRLWNYRKTPKRGVRGFSVMLDGALLFMGSLRRAPPLPEEYAGQPILFTNDPCVVRREKENILYCGEEEQDVLCIDERQVRVRSRWMHAAPDPCAEGITANLADRPTTAVVGTR
ncbi:unnamed protein product [Choristocarpus tenellus]